MKATDPGLMCVCDPILGDDHTGLYVPQAVAEAVRDRLVPLADVIVPNRFELEWLAGKQVGDAVSAAAAAQSVGQARTIVTSLPAGEGLLQTALANASPPAAITTRRREAIPHGTGDLLTGLIAGRLLAGEAAAAALGQSLAMLERVLDASAGKPVLDLAPLAPPTAWPAPLEGVPT